MQSVRNSVSAISLALAGFAAWMLSSFLTPYITSPDAAECLMNATEVTSLIGWGVGIFGISTALAVQRGNLDAGRAVRIASMTIGLALVGSYMWLLYFQQSHCAAV